MFLELYNTSLNSVFFVNKNILFIKINTIIGTYKQVNFIIVWIIYEFYLIFKKYNTNFTNLIFQKNVQYLYNSVQIISNSVQIITNSVQIATNSVQ